ncbi:MAG: hypothetical protein COV57_01355 [Candidatus Liptonbacteria bacterium CG11_big_fil_rev_8_21_14_0_20_35_14]|uniref:RNA polymerase subunit sigma-70 n=1 Tax=Candidatus Liptonbacteria bacterium CG11_big_fil_rev_8_21_14_0_20_35_14 TaxID=1974634 RepID=A0A2H0N808_9BACT|nr:MAG: hypothetical protein COV57_01355 [Candidatus Liptonbacteria bacterium CG11_big_fil_rev_8_21_14_0_20_35_14]
MIESEHKLIQQAKQGESSAFGVLYDNYHEKIFRFVYFKVSHKEEAEDLTHQVFLNAWKNIRNYKDQNLPFSSWLYRIAKNKVIDYYRLKKNNTSLDSIKDSLHDDYNIELATEEILNLENIRNAIKELNEDQQDVLIMRFIEDLPIKEVATSLGKTESAVKLIQLRAIKKLKNIIKNGTDYITA